MAKPYDFDCECRVQKQYPFLEGRQSELLLNGERHNIYEAVKHLIDYPSNANSTPTAKHKGSLWYDQRTNTLYAWVGPGYKHDRVRNGWLPISTDKFQITDEILNDVPTSNPVLGQLWLYNGALLYWSGTAWDPVKTVEQSGSQFSMSIFDNFHLYSPLSRLGSAVISDLELEAYLEIQRLYEAGDFNLDTESMAKLIERWNLDTIPDIQKVIDFNLEDVSYQYLVPNIKADRVFIDGKLDLNYVVQSNSVIQYKRSYLLDEQNYWNDDTPLITHIKKPSLVHINIGQASRMKKRLFKVDKMNPKIMCPVKNTEFYGYTIGDTRGHFLIPTVDVEEELYQYKQLIKSVSEENKAVLENKLRDLGYDLDASFIKDTKNTTGDYVVQNDGIYLTYEASEQYDYVLSITYEFNWIKSTGSMIQADNRIGNSSYYIPERLGSVNVFVNGFDYEDAYYSWDSKNTTVTLAEEIPANGEIDVAVLGVFAHEYGFIREMNLTADNRSARISTIHKFLRPLIFVNGEVLTRSSWQYFDRATQKDTERPGTSFTLYGVHRDMAWTMIDMQQIVYDYNEDGVAVNAELVDICIEEDGLIDSTEDFVDSYANRAIPIPEWVEIKYEDSDDANYKRPFVVLFVNGLMVRREDVYYDKDLHKITCEGLMPGQTYVLLNDPEQKLYTEGNGVKPALSIGRIDNSLVYLNGYLLNEPESYLYHGDMSFATMDALHGEIRAFDNGTQWKIFSTTVADQNDPYGKWEDAPSTVISEVKFFSDSYTNANSSISYSKSLNIKSTDTITIFGFKLANYVESPTIPVTCWLHQNNRGTYFMKEAGYSDEYIDLIRSENTSSIYLTKLDPANPTTLTQYQQDNNLYYKFLYDAYGYWATETGTKNNKNLTLKQKIAAYKTASTQSNSDLTGYFYDGVYMRNDDDKATYIDLRDTAKGILWVNKVFIGKEYDPYSDYVMVWLNGVRQYPEEDYVIEPEYDNLNILVGYHIILGHYDVTGTLVPTVDDDGYTEVPHGGTQSAGKEPLTGMLTYIIQKPEDGSKVACRHMILDHTHCVSGAQNVYTTKDLDPDHVDPVSYVRDTSYDFSLYPGNVTIYADGVRLSKSAYQILDNYTIVINSEDPFIGSMYTYPTQQILDINHNVLTIRHLQPERLLVEVRENSSWTERTVTTDKDFTGEFDVLSSDTQLPVSILNTPDTILIFVDGLYHGLTQNDGYTINKTLGAVILRDSTVYSALKVSDLESYIAQHKGIENYYTKELAAYRERHKNNPHQVTFEWR